MYTKQSISRVFSVLLVVLMMSGTASARPLNAPLGTALTYQGRLTDGGAPANGTYDLEFKLYEALSGGSPVGSTVTLGEVTVTNGLFTVQLDFGNVFDGTALYLDVGVRPGASVGAYTPLTPRQQLTAAPYALYASKSPWSGLTGVPAGFADGVDNGSAYANVKVVAKSGGDFTTISAALTSITDNSPTSHYLVYVAPGTYSETVTMKPFVDIEGAGELTTKITSTGSELNNTGTVVAANYAELRLLTAENTGGLMYAIAIYDYMRAPRLTHVTASALGGTFNYGVYDYASSPTMQNVTAGASGENENYGVFNYASSSPTMTNVTASAFGGTDLNYGVYNNSSSPAMAYVTASASGGTENYGVYNNSSSPSMKNVTASAAGGNTNSGVYNHSSSPAMAGVTAIGSGGTYANNGVVNDASSSPVMMNVTAKATGGGVVSYAVYNVGSFPTMTNVSAIAEAGGLNMSNGVYNRQSSATINNSFISGMDIGIQNFAASGIYTVTVNNSQISGSTNTIINVTGFTTRVGGSYLNGGPAAASGGSLTCAGVYDEAYAFYASTCP
jgi:hypothetical protein